MTQLERRRFKGPGLTSVPVTISALTGDGVHAHLRLSYTERLSGLPVEVDISRTAYDSKHPWPHAGNWKVAFRTGAAVPPVSAVATVVITSLGNVRIFGMTAANRAFSRGTMMIDPARIPFYMNCIRATTETVQGTLNFAADRVTGDLRWVVPAGAEPELADGVDETYAAKGNRFTGLPSLTQSGIFTLGGVSNTATLETTGLLKRVPRGFALVSKGGGRGGFGIVAGVRTTFKGVYLPLDVEAIRFSRQAGSIGEVSFAQGQ
jgi:hypothetical protein